MYPWVFNVYIDAGMKEVKMGRGETVEVAGLLVYR